MEENELQNYWGNIPSSPSEFYKQQGIKSTSSYYTSPRDLTLFTRSWQPLTTPRAIICMIHGYGNDISWTYQSTPIYLAQQGFSCFALDLEGHGLSQGLQAYVPNVDLVALDCFSYFQSIPNPDNLPRFLFGESMGAAICLLIHLKNLSLADFFNGAVLIAPMCRISDNVKPRFPVTEFLRFIAWFAPTLAIVSTADLLDKSVKVEEKRVLGRKNPRRYKGKPRLGTVVELLRVTEYLSGKLEDVEIPFIVMHGDEDVVTDVEVSLELYEKARSEDKSVRIYRGMMHSLLFGETDENVGIVRGDLLAWLNDRC